MSLEDEADIMPLKEHCLNDKAYLKYYAFIKPKIIASCFQSITNRNLELFEKALEYMSQFEILFINTPCFR